MSLLVWVKWRTWDISGPQAICVLSHRLRPQPLAHCDLADSGMIEWVILRGCGEYADYS